MALKVVGQKVIRNDLVPKCTGTALFASDLQLPGMLTGALLRSPYAHAKINSIDTSEAEKLPGVVCVITDKDEDILSHEAFSDALYALASIPREVFFAGQVVAIVAAETEETAEEAIKLIKVDYAPLPVVFDPKEALQPDAPVLHPEYAKLRPDLPANIAPTSRGYIVSRKGPKAEDGHKDATASKADIEQGKKDADLIVEGHYTVEAETHAVLETHRAIAKWDGDAVTIWVAAQNIHNILSYVVRFLRIPQTKASIIANYVGAGFGGKGVSGQSVQLTAVYAAALSKKAGRPVRIVTQADEFIIYSHHSDGPLYYDTRGGIKKDGTPTFLETTLTVSQGGCGNGGLQAGYPAGESAVAVYKYGSVYCEAWPVWDNLNISASRRSYGDAEGMISSEQFIDEMVEKINADPVEWRTKWAEMPGDPVTLRYEWAEFAGGNFPVLIRKAADAFDWKHKWKGWGVPTAINGPKRRGVGCALSMHVTGSSMHHGLVKINTDGSVEAISAAHEIGQGIKSAMAQAVAEVLGVSYNQVRVSQSNTATTPEGGGVSASQGTPNAIGASVLAAKDAKRQLFEIAATNLKVKVGDLDIGGGKVFVKSDPSKFQTLAAIARSRMSMYGQGWEVWPWLNKNGIQLSEKSLAALFAEIEVDTETGKIDILKIVSCDDCGIAINPDAVLAQIYGGVVMGIGFGMYGALLYDKANEGVVINASPVDYKIPSYLETPEIVPIIHEDPADAPTCQLNLKGMGEGAIVPVAPAIANAFYNATGVRIRNHPWTPDKVLKALGKI